ncbi:high affinity cGMP-specific 3',5'-cyclic phosphodiesterase 9A isoform X2 [Uranotaenia lowii]|uniref:high affinity cGMP-specific 3',5'-cyclic phosphodiesterase 9A isoform X2 n=1 Tax=Uranotaenia lowii TaxID=190385 RepID=UPI002478DA3F|nr:high affinity cGMP-specific 3',5'-cyclic phosphodiesterase 9A isoform X2 [Uranotaenia lowii]
MYHKARAGHCGVDVKLLADVGYIADRLRSLEQRWELAELKDIHKRIVLGLEEHPVNVVRAIQSDQLRPVQSDLHGRSQLQQEVERAAEASHAVEAIKRQQRIENRRHSCNDNGDIGLSNDEQLQTKLAQLEDFLITFYRSYAEVRRASQKSKKTKKQRDSGSRKKVYPFLPSSSSTSSSSRKASSEVDGLRTKCDSQCATKSEPAKEPKQQSFTTSQADRTMNQDRELEDPNLATAAEEAATAQQQPTVDPLRETTADQSNQGDEDNHQGDAKQNSPAKTISNGNSVSTTPQRTSSEATTNTNTKEEDDDDTTTTTTTTVATTASQQTVINADEQQEQQLQNQQQSTTEQQKRPSLDAPTSSPISSARITYTGCDGDSTEPDEEEDDDDDDDVGTTGAGGVDTGSGGGGNEACGRNKLRKRISELTNNVANAKQFQQLCDNIDAINDVELRALIRELKRKIEFAERMNWMCLSSRPRGPPHRKTSLPKHSDVKKRFLEIADTTLSDEVKAALRLPAFDSYEWEDWDVIHLMQTMFVELNLVEKFEIPRTVLREWLYEVYKHYNDVPFHNYRHCFCVAQMMYAITWHTNLVQRLGELEVLILLVSCICHDLDHPGYNNIYQINARTELALRYNDISPLENHHCSIAFRLLEHPDCNIFRNMDKELYKDVREGIIRCILATDMARHNEILTQFQEATPIFDFNNKVHTNLLCMVLIKVADISNEARPMEVAEPWLDRLLQEFFAQSAAEKSEGLPVTPFMDPDKVSKPGSQVRFIGLVLLPLFEALGELLPELTDMIIMPVRVALDYYKKLNDAAQRKRRSIAEELSSENNSTGTIGTGTDRTTTGGSSGAGGVLSSSGTPGGAGTGSGTGGGGSATGSPQLPRSQSGISVKSRPELHDLPEGSESGDSETATEVDVAEKTSKFKVDTESSHRKQSHPSSRKGSREKRPSMIGEYYTTGTRIRGSHGNIQHTNRTYFGSNRAISLDQYSNSRRMSDGIQIQTVVSDNSVYYHQRQHRSLEHDSNVGIMYSSSDKSTSLNSTNEQQQPPTQSQPPHIHGPFQSSHHAHFHHLHYQQQAAAALHQLRAVQDCENMNFCVSTAAAAGATTATAASGKLCASSVNNNNNSSSNNNNKSISKRMNWSQQQKLEKIRNASNINNNAGGGGGSGGGGGCGSEMGGKEGVVGGQSSGKGGEGLNGTNGSASKSIISRLRQLTGRLSFNFDSKESKKMQKMTAVVGADEEANEPHLEGTGNGGCGPQGKKARVLEKSKTVDVGGSVAVCGGSGADYCCSGGVIVSQPKSISPILMHHRNSDIISTINAARSRAYSLDVPIPRNCCRSLSGSTAGGGGSSCGGSHKSLTFSLNKSLNEEGNDATISSSGGGGGLRQPPQDDSNKCEGSIGETI